MLINPGKKYAESPDPHGKRIRANKRKKAMIKEKFKLY
jgi:hypothetical protein